MTDMAGSEAERAELEAALHTGIEVGVRVQMSGGYSSRVYDAMESVGRAMGANPVPLIISGADVKLRPGRLADIAPTMLELMGIRKPAKMTGESLIVNE